MIKIGIVGTGIISLAHINAIQKSDRCKLIAVTDIVLEKAKEMGQQFGVNYYTDYKQMQEQEHLDAVILNLPHFLHCEVSVYFLNKGIHVLVEKPMANTVQECEMMIRTAQENNVKLAVAHVQRFFAANQKVKKMIEEETYGKLCMMTEVRNTFYFNESRPKWFLDKKLSGGGILMNYFAHTLDKWFYVLDDNITQVNSHCDNLLNGYNVEGNAQIFLKIDNGISANATFCAYKTPPFYETTYYFSHGAVKVVDTTKLYVSENEQFALVEIPDEKDAFELQLEEFLKYIQGKECNIVTAEYGKKVIQIIEQAYQNH